MSHRINIATELRSDKGRLVLWGLLSRRQVLAAWLALTMMCMGGGVLAQSRGEEFSALEYAAGADGLGSSPSAACAMYANVWGWNKNGLSYTTDQELPGRWKCQRYFNGVLEPSWYAWVLGRCQTKSAAPILTGSRWSYPYWDLNAGVCYCQSPENYFDRSVQWCDLALTPPFRPDFEESCPTGNPVYPASGIKQQHEQDYTSAGLLSLNRTYAYRSQVTKVLASVGARWRLRIGPVLEVPPGTKAGPVRVLSSRGAVVLFNPDGAGGWAAVSGTRDRLEEVVDAGTRTGWHFYDLGNNTVSAFSSSGQLLALAAASGDSLQFAYGTTSTPITVAATLGALINVKSWTGRGIDFITATSGVTQAVVPGSLAGVTAGLPQSPIRYAYNEAASLGAGVGAKGQLTSVIFQDGTVRKYHYEDTRFPLALSGITDELGNRLSDYRYDVNGRVVSENWRNGSSGNVKEYSFSYAVAGQTTITGPLRSPRIHSYTHRNGVNLPVGDSQPAGAGCPASSSSRSYDTRGNVTSKTDFNGTKSCHAYDPSRNLETARLEGLANADACPADIATQEIASDVVQRKTLTQWHPDWSLPVKKAEPGKLTINVYNGQPDPTAGDATASCAPTAALLPDGKRIAVLCKTVEQATTDATGALGFNATPTGSPWTWTYTYNEHGQVLTARDPLNNLTTYAYYSDTTAEHTRGDLQSVTNPAGHTTQYKRYDRSGRLLESVDANGTKTETTYTPRGWVKTVTTTPPGAPAQATVYDYDGVGQLKKATLSDGTALEYTYDAAHRLRSVKDAAGNAVTYTLDNMGNRTGEELKDASGTLARNITRVYDALNRVQSATGAAQ